MIKLDKSNDNSIIEFRKKRRSIKRLKFFLTIAVMAVVIGTVYLMRDTIFEPFHDIVSRVANDENTEGFPVKLTGSASYYFSKLDDNFVLLTDTYLYSYNGNGGLVSSIQHGYQNPIDKTNSKRVLLYDKGARDFSLLNRSGKIYEKTLDDNIVYGRISNGDLSAIVTTSNRYANYLYVFNGSGTQIFRWASVDNKIMQVKFSDDERYVYVTAVGSNNGEVVTHIYCFDLNNSEGEIWKTVLNGGIPYDMDLFTGGIIVVSSEDTFLINGETGEILDTYAYTKTIKQFCLSEDFIAFMFSDSLSSNTIFTTINSDFEIINSTSLPSSVNDVVIASDMIYFLIGSELVVYNKALEEINRIALDDEYSRLIINNNYAYLLGYDTVQRAQLN